MIKYLKTRNFKKLDDWQVEFKAGSNILTGDNSAGKSTVFKAIRFALFGAAASGSSKENLPTYGTKNCKVELGIADLVIKRDLTNCKIIKGNKTVAEGNTPCTRYIEDFLGMDFKAFNIFCLSSQGETQALLTIGATEINKRVEQYSGITLIDEVITRAKADIDKNSAVLESLELVDLETLENQKKDLEHTINTVQEDKAKVDNQLERVNNDLSDAREAVENAKLTNQQVTHAKAQIGEYESSLSIALNRNETLKERALELGAMNLDSDSIKAAIELKTKQVIQMREDNDKSTRTKAKIELMEKTCLELFDYASREVIAVKSLPSINEKIAQEEQSLEAVRNDISELRAKERAMKKTLNEGVCSECGRPHEDFDPESVRQELQDIKKQILQSDETLESGYRQVKKSAAKKLEYQRHINNYVDKYEAAKKELEELKTIEETIPNHNEEMITNLDERLDDLKFQLRTIDNHKTELAKIQSEMPLIQEQIDELTRKKLDAQEMANQPQTDVESLISKVSTLEQQYTKLYADLNQLASSLSGFKQERSHLEEQLNKGRANNSKFDDLSKYVGARKDLINLLRNKRQQFMSDVWQRIIDRASNFLNETTNGWIEAVYRDDKGGFSFKETGQKPSPIIGNASGAQAAFCGTAIRIGISQALYGSSALLMLDEPTESMTEKNSSVLASGLLNLGGQVLLITHRSSEAFTAQNVIELGK